ncbi:MAG: peptidase M43, partial [Gammaproteobacteria bacterium]|nr:peptidase M43 [Gammaproteobacteria bacterium]
PERFWDFSGSTFNMQRLDYPIHGMILAIQSRPLAQLYNGLLMGRILDLELRSEIGEDPLTLPEMFGEVRDAIWSEVAGARNVDSYRRALQRQHLKHLINLVVQPTPGTPEDASTLARADLKALNTAIERALSRGGLDAYTEAHLDETSARIEAALDADLIRKAG